MTTGTGAPVGHASAGGHPETRRELKVSISNKYTCQHPMAEGLPIQHAIGCPSLPPSLTCSHSHPIGFHAGPGLDNLGESLVVSRTFAGFRGE